MPRIPRSWLPHQVTFRTKTSGPRGDVASDPETIRRCYVEEGIKLLRQADGQSITSSAQVWVQPENHLDVGTFVTIHPGTDQEREAVVLGFKRYDRPGLMNHSVLYLE